VCSGRDCCASDRLRQIQGRLTLRLLQRTYSANVRRPGGRTSQPISNPSQEILAIVEAEFGALLEFLPAPLLVTSEAGEILRANRAAVLFLDRGVPIIHQRLDVVIGSQLVDVSTTTLRYKRTVLRLCALQHHNW